MSLFATFYEKAKKDQSLTSPLSVNVKMTGEDGSIMSLSAKSNSPTAASTPKEFAEVLARSAEVRATEKHRFERSQGAQRVNVSGSFAGEFYLAHETGVAAKAAKGGKNRLKAEPEAAGEGNGEPAREPATV